MIVSPRFSAIASFLAPAILWLCAPHGQAQSERWLVLPTVVDDEGRWMEPAVSKVTRELRRQGVGVWPSDAAVSSFQARGSSTPPVVSQTRVEAWTARSQQALRNLALGDVETALSELREAQDFARAALVTLNRSEARAQTVLDTCLYLVRALVQTGDEAGAAAQVKECVRNGIGVEPTRQMHPPTVVDLYEAAAAINPERSSTLLVESEPTSCPVRVGGVRVGDTPHQLGGLYPGRYQVQVECDPERAARVHTVEVRRGATSMFVFDRFDQSVRTTPLLHLRYETAPEPRTLARDARQLARTLPASTVVVASTPGDGILELRTITGADPAVVRLATSGGEPASDDVAKATAALLAGDCQDFSGDATLALDCKTGEPVARAARGEAPRRPRPPSGQFIAGVTLASVGTASLLSSYGLVIARRSAGDDWIASPNSLSAQEKWWAMGTGVIATSAIGSGFLVAAMPLALPYRAKTPWWAWVSGGVGVAAAAVSIASAATASAKPPQACTVVGPDPTPCVDRGRDTDRAIILGATAAPLLTMPLVYLLRKSDKKLEASLSPTVVMSRRGGAIGVRGEF